MFIILVVFCHLSLYATRVLACVQESEGGMGYTAASAFKMRTACFTDWLVIASQPPLNSATKRTMKWFKLSGMHALAEERGSPAVPLIY